MINEMNQKRRIPFCIFALAVLYIFVSVATFYIPLIYERLALWPVNNNTWQYFSFIFTSMVKPQEALIFNVIMSLMGLLTFGMIVEKKAGFFRTLSIILVEWAVTAGLFILITDESYISVSGISTIVYAFATISFISFVKILKKEGIKLFKQASTVYYAVLYLYFLVMLLPVMDSLEKTCLNLSGIVIGIIASGVYREKVVVG